MKPLTPLDPRCGHSQRESWHTVAACVLACVVMVLLAWVRR